MCVTHTHTETEREREHAKEKNRARVEEEEDKRSEEDKKLAVYLETDSMEVRLTWWVANTFSASANTP